MFNAWKNHSRVALSPQLDPLENFQVVSTFARLPEDFIISFLVGVTDLTSVHIVKAKSHDDDAPLQLLEASTRIPGHLKMLPELSCK